jgi:hypothetical protein
MSAIKQSESTLKQVRNVRDESMAAEEAKEGERVLTEKEKAYEEKRKNFYNDIDNEEFF